MPINRMIFKFLNNVDYILIPGLKINQLLKIQTTFSLNLKKFKKKIHSKQTPDNSILLE